ncbi:CARDB domain-containing protein [Haloarcula halophila]|uniref:CARDB domain-containing protein n=2 Tax=Haloarcula TaxID=2237 RepID=UPI0023E427FA|nr:CARDB domain-containing protein [Halomicroarcula sp. DFY41]
MGGGERLPMRTSTIAVVVFVVVLSGTVAASTSVNASDPPLADAGLDQTVSPGTTVHLDANGSRDPDGRLSSVRWRIDGPAGSSVTPDCRSCRQTTFRPTTVGQYNVTLTVTDDDGQTRSDALEVVVEPDDGPVVSLAGPATTSQGRPTTIQANLTTTAGRLDTLAWVINGEFVRREPVTGTETTVSLTRRFDATGSVQVRAVAYDTGGHRGTASHGVTVTQPLEPPTPGPPPGPGEPQPTPEPGPPPTNGSQPGGGNPSFGITQLTAPTRATTSSAVPVTATVQNTGTARGTYPARLLVNGSEVGREPVTVDPSASGTATFRHQFTQPGTYNLTVGTQSTLLEVGPAVSGNSGRIFVETIHAPDEVQEGTTTTVYGRVVNTDTTTRTLDTPFAIDGRTVDTKSVTVEPSETRYVAFNATFDTPGARTVSIGTESTTVVVDPVADPPTFRVVRLTTPNQTLDVGERGTFIATVRNVGERPGTYDATLTVDGESVQTQSVALPVGAERQVRFTNSFADDGNYSVSVGTKQRSVEVVDFGQVRVSSLDVPNRVETDENFDVSATITNTYSHQEVQDFELYINGKLEGRKEYVSISGGSQTTVVWENRYLEHRGAFPRTFEIRVRYQRGNVTVVPPVTEDTSNAGSTCDGAYVWTDMDGDLVGCLDQNSTDIHYSDDGEEVWIDANGKDGLQISQDGEMVTIMNDTTVEEHGGKIPGNIVQKYKRKEYNTRYIGGKDEDSSSTIDLDGMNTKDGDSDDGTGSCPTCRSDPADSRIGCRTGTGCQIY